MKKQALFVFPLLVLTALTHGCIAEQFEQVLEVPQQREALSALLNSSPVGRIAIVSHSTLDIKYIDTAIDNHKRYAKKHGYDYIFRNNLITVKYVNPKRHSKVFQNGLYWQKIQAVKDALESGYEWVLWIDPDALFTDFDTRIEDLLSQYRKNDEEFLIAHEGFCFVNTGVFLVHQSAWAHEMLNHIELLFPKYKNTLLPEQLAVQDYVLGFVSIGADGTVFATEDKDRNYHKLPIRKTIILNQRAINSFYHGNRWLPGASSVDAVWQPGDFIAHFAVRMSAKGAEMKALTDCFKNRCGEDYENFNQCLLKCK